MTKGSKRRTRLQKQKIQGQAQTKARPSREVPVRYFSNLSFHRSYRPRTSELVGDQENSALVEIVLHVQVPVSELPRDPFHSS